MRSLIASRTSPDGRWANASRGSIALFRGTFPRVCAHRKGPQLWIRRLGGRDERLVLAQRGIHDRNAWSRLNLRETQSRGLPMQPLSCARSLVAPGPPCTAGSKHQAGVRLSSLHHAPIDWSYLKPSHSYANGFERTKADALCSPFNVGVAMRPLGQCSRWHESR
jgi:hypothetical protein